ncbi:hypothetical protein HZU77_012550 [Neisseriaceae bacterium TC5R-5]|nr:hypothetical protein [Neisseriaceae bacterium TC5R-5]
MSPIRHHLPDPRQYHPEVALTNQLIYQIQTALEASTAQERDNWLAAARDALVQRLERHELLSISVALAMVPSQACYQLLWQCLRTAVEETNGTRAMVFAMPLILVAGSKQQQTLPGEIADVAGLNALLRQHSVFAEDGEVFIQGALVSADSLLALDAAMLFQLNHDPSKAKTGLPQQAAPITVKEEGVFLRYLLGVAIQPEGADVPVRLGGEVGAWGMPLMKFLNEQLHGDGVTLFPIARPPLPAMQAMVAGHYARFEVALQVFVSSQIRRLRELNLEPVAILAAHQNGELHITLSAVGDQRSREGFAWPLAPLDSVQLIEENFRELMAECRVREVHVLAQLQAELRDGRPYFIVADDLPQLGEPQE